MKKFRILIAEHYGKEINIKAKTEEEAIKIYEKKGYSDDQVYREKFIESQFCEIKEVE
jgi:hypothetical protein